MRETENTIKEENISSNFLANPHFAFYRISHTGMPVYANLTFLRMLGFTTFDEMIDFYEREESFRENFSAKKY